MSTTFVLPELDAFHLGALLAIYEQKVYVQSTVWGINAFDQFGVELGKTLMAPIAAALTSDAAMPEATDGSTRGLVAHVRAQSARTRS